MECMECKECIECMKCYRSNIFGFQFIFTHSSTLIFQTFQTRYIGSFSNGDYEEVFTECIRSKTPKRDDINQKGQRPGVISTAIPEGENYGHQEKRTAIQNHASH